MIVATAGHVDHGKTSLIKHLTGVDTDRLEEEKRRGLSINLGFAYRKLAGHSPIGFVDVPGHNRFINTMIAGVCGIDLGMLIVAADDGPMPQTFEHLDVLRLLGVTDFVVVVTKTDRVAAERVQAVSLQMRELLPKGEGEVPLFAVCNTSGEGVAALLAHLEHCARHAAARSARGGFRLSIDRAFTLKGAGLVVTGTATAGSVRVGDVLNLQPADVTLRVRNLHVHAEQADTACAGQRCALNVVGDVARERIARGDWLLQPGAGPLSACIDARVRLLDTAPFAVKHLSPVKIYLGARRVAGRLFVLEGAKRLGPGADALVQLLLDEPVSSCHGERFLLRDDSESVTLGGGVVLDLYAPRKGKSRPQRLQTLHALETDTARDALAALVLEQQQLLDLERFRHNWNLREDELAPLYGPEMHRIDIDGATLLISAQRWQQELAAIPDYLTQWHQRNPLAAGIGVPQLRSALDRPLEAPLFAALLRELLQTSVLTLQTGMVCLSGHKVSLADEDAERLHKFEAFLQQCGNDIPLLSQVVTATGLRKKTLTRLAHVAVRDGRLHKLTDNRFATPQQLAHLAQEVLALAADNQAINVVNFKSRMGTGRKVAIEVLEYFDSIRFTRRRGDVREVVDAGVIGRVFGG